jgi:hypothetical protein
MKTLAPALQAHLDEGTTTLAWCWRIARADGVTFGFTDHDRTLTFDGTDFEPESGLTASEVRSGSDLSVDAQDAEGVLTSDRMGAVSLAALVRHLCLRAGLPESLIDVTGLWGAVEGYAITALESPRASITTLSRHFGFDAVETEGVIRFVMRGRASVVTLAPDYLVSTREGDVLELTRGQETELPQALRWQVARADEDYDAALVEARRITVDTTRIASESFPMAVPPEEAERRCRRALMEAWVGRETAAFRLPPSRLVLNGSTEIRGSRGEISGAHFSEATALWLQTMVSLTAGETVELQGNFRASDGYFAADHTSFWGAKIG